MRKGCLAFGAGLLLLEVVARLAGTVLEDVTPSPREWWVSSPTLGWVKRAGYSGNVYGTSREFPVVERRDAEVVFLGDSVTFGFRVADAASFPRLVESQRPSLRVVSLGVPGYTSYQGRVALEEYLVGAAAAPRAVVVAFGFNDRRSVLSAEDVDSKERFARTDAALRREALLARLSLSRVVRGLAFVAARLSPRSAPGPTAVQRLMPRVSSEAYRANLEAIMALAAGRGAKVIFLALHDNPIMTSDLRRGAALAATPEGLDLLKAAVRRSDEFSDLARLTLAAALRERGDAAGADKASVVEKPFVSQHGGTLVRWDTEYLGVLREVATATGATVVEGGTALDAHPADYLDYCHPDANGHRVLAGLLLSVVDSR